MINVFDITEFGAVGDGVTDCTDAVQKAFDAAKDCKGQVIVPPGAYAVKGDLKLRGEGVSLQGMSAWSYRNPGASAFILTNEKAECLIDISGAFGCTVSGISLDGQNLGENIHGIRLTWPVANGGGQEDTPNIEDCRISCFTGDGMHLNHVWCFSVRRNHVVSNRGAALRFCGWDAFITDNWFANNFDGGIATNGYVASITATGNRVEWNKKGGFIIASGDSFNFTGNFFDRTFGPALKLGFNGGVVNLASITGNVFRRGGCHDGVPFEDSEMSCHVLMNGCTGCTLVGNTMKVGAGDGNVMPISPDFGMIIKNCEYCIIKDNAMHNGSMLNNLIEENNKECVIEGNIGCLFEG